MFNIPRTNTIGHEDVYPQSWDVAAKCCELLAQQVITFSGRHKKYQHVRTPIIQMQPQQGKTAVMIVLIYMVLTWCKNNNKTVQIVVISSLNDTSLASQTEDRLTRYTDNNGLNPKGARLDLYALECNAISFGKDGIKVTPATASLPNLRSEVPQGDHVNIRLWILDEIHCGNERNSLIHQTLREFGVDLSKSPDKWSTGKTINLVVGVSATPYAHTLLSDGIALEDASLFKRVSSSPIDIYNSLSRMAMNGRLQQTENLFIYDRSGSMSELTTFGRALFAKKKCGYGVVRVLGKKHTDLLDYLREHDIDHTEIDAAHGNIYRLNSILKEKPESFHIIVIKGAARAGVTFDITKYILWMCDQNSKNADTVAQSLAGRACGYNNKISDTFPVYCNLEAVAAAIRYYEEEGFIPSGIQNSRYSQKKQAKTGIERVFNTKKEAENYLLANGHDTLQFRCATTSGFKRRDIVGAWLASRSKPSSATCSITFDGCGERGKNESALSFFKRKSSWDTFVKEYPELVGKTIILNEDGQEFDTRQTSENALKKGCALNTKENSVVVVQKRNVPEKMRTTFSVVRGGKAA